MTTSGISPRFDQHDRLAARYPQPDRDTVSESPQPAPEAPKDAGWEHFAADPVFRGQVGKGFIDLLDLAKARLTVEHSTSRGTMRDFIPPRSE